MKLRQFAVLGAVGMIVMTGYSSAGIEGPLSSEAALGDIVKNPDGSVSHMNQYDSEKYCLAQGSRLPTAKELAKESQRLLAKGVHAHAKHLGVSVDSYAVNTEIDQMRRDGYRPIYTKNSSGQKVVDFYFNNSGYERPAGELGNYFFWSSSVHPVYSDYAYGLYGYDGDFVYDSRHISYAYCAVRCVLAR